MRSYRGYYDQLAITPSDERRTVADLLADARKADGATFEGWKGGDFKMDRTTAVWLSDAGDASGLGVGELIQNFEAVCFSVVDVNDYQGW